MLKHSKYDQDNKDSMSLGYAVMAGAILATSALTLGLDVGHNDARTKEVCFGLETTWDSHTI